MTLKEFAERYGPTAAVIAVIVLLVVLLPGNDQGGGTDLSSTGRAAAGIDDFGGGDGDGDVTLAGDTDGVELDGGTRSNRTGASGPSGGGRAGGSTGLGGQQATTPPPPTSSVFVKSGPNCRPDGRQSAISLYSPLCAEWEPGMNNGGATARGVFPDKVIVVWHRTQSDPATDAALAAAGADDTDEDQTRIYEAFRRYFNHHTQTYGREVVVIQHHASGPNENDAAMKADVIHIAEKIGAFAVWSGTSSPVFPMEAAARGLICICTTSQSQQYYEAARQASPCKCPLIFSSLPTLEEYYDHIAEYWLKRLAGKPAEWAGTATARAQKRKFGLIYYEGVRGRADPVRRDASQAFKNQLAQHGVDVVDIGYIYDLSQAGNHSQGIITKLKNEGVNHVVIVGDPLYPIFITKEATKQNYFPEWFISGTVLIDTTFFGRTYDQAQWRNAFGISPLWVFWEDVQKSYGARTYHHGRPGERAGREGVAVNVYEPFIRYVFTAIQMAGPNLTPANASKGMLSLPPIGGTPAAPLVYFTADRPTAIKDFTEVWWDETGRGKDETNKEGVGILMKSNNGQRYRAGQWPTSNPNVFDPNGAVYTTDNPEGGQPSVPHEEDGHTHDYANKRCLSCG